MCINDEYTLRIDGILEKYNDYDATIAQVSKEKILILLYLKNNSVIHGLNGGTMGMGMRIY